MLDKLFRYVAMIFYYGSIFALLYFLLIYSLGFGIDIGWFLLFFCGLFFIVNLLTILPSFSCLYFKIPASHTFRAQSNGKLSGEITTLTGKKGFYPNLILELLPKADTENELLANAQLLFKRSQTIQWPVHELPRGIYAKPEVRVTSKDLFGLFYKSRQFKLPTYLCVLPAESQGGAEKVFSYLYNSQQAVFPSPNFVSSQELKSIQEYQYGDPLNQIDWKLSARYQHLMRKHYEQESEEQPAWKVLFFPSKGNHFEASLRLFYDFQKLVFPFSTTFLGFNQAGQLVEKLDEDYFATVTSLKKEAAALHRLQNVDIDQEVLLVFASASSKRLLKELNELAKSTKVILVSQIDEKKIDIMNFQNEKNCVLTYIKM